MSLSATKINNWLATASEQLELAGVGTGRLDSLVLLEDELGRDRAWLLANPQGDIKRSILEKLNKKLARRARHEPLAYIRGKTEFYGRPFHINKHVLEPRPESEAMIEELKYLRVPMRPRIADIGTGSGALGITAALELRACLVDMYDIDPKALKMAQRNAKRHKVNLRFYEADLLGQRPAVYDVIMANLPYVPSRYHINQAAAYEPQHAIYGGGDGLELYRRLFNQLMGIYNKPRFVLTEALPNQHVNLAGMAELAGFTHRRTNDFIQVFENRY